MSHSVERTPPHDRATLPAGLARGLSQSQLPALDGLRAVAAYLVVFYHFELTWIPGGLGVLAFFVLSGFLITWLLLKEHDRHGAVSLRLFYLRRALRIFPAFYAYAGLLIVALVLLHKRIVWPQTLASVFYVNNYYQAIAGDPNTGLSHTWSLAIEEQFYLLWPVCFAALIGRPRAMGRVLVAAIAGVWIHRWVLLAPSAFSGHLSNHGYIYEAFDTRADHLMAGCLLAVALYHGWGATLWTWLCARTVQPLFTIVALAVSSALAYRIDGYRDAVGFAVEPLLVAALIVQLIAFSDLAPWRFLNWGVVRYLGRISYSVYLYQQLIPSVVAAALRGRPFSIQLAAHVIGVTLAASASYWIVERPFLTIKDRLGRRAGGQQSAPLPNVVTAPAS